MTKIIKSDLRKVFAMCCCGTPTMNGQPGYRWQPNDAPTTREVAPPTLLDGDVLLYDEPGRCGGLDSHHLHIRLVKHRFGDPAILVKHGGGEERIRLPYAMRLIMPSIEAMDSNTRYWMLSAFHSVHRHSADDAREKESALWRTAAAEKRIKTRKYPSRGAVKVWIEPKAN